MAGRSTPDSDERLLAALRQLDLMISDNVARSREIQRRVRHIDRKVRSGRSLAETVQAEAEPRTMEMITANIDALQGHRCTVARRTGPSATRRGFDDQCDRRSLRRHSAARVRAAQTKERHDTHLRVTARSRRSVGRGVSPASRPRSMPRLQPVHRASQINTDQVDGEPTKHDPHSRIASSLTSFDASANATGVDVSIADSRADNLAGKSSR